MEISARSQRWPAEAQINYALPTKPAAAVTAAELELGDEAPAGSTAARLLAQRPLLQAIAMSMRAPANEFAAVDDAEVRVAGCRSARCRRPLVKCKEAWRRWA